MKWYLTQPAREFTSWQPLSMGLDIPNVSLPTPEPSAALHGNGWNLLPLTDNPPTVPPERYISARYIRADPESALAIYQTREKTPEMIEAEKPQPGQLITYKADVWRRSSAEQAAAIDTELTKLDVRMRRLWDDAQYLDHSTEEFTLLRTTMIGAFGQAEADRILAPSDA